ncbi:hypothetical protein [Streptosporangium sp. OZ121]|uniref:hypothetical protein n=1 Tax=Streptosporangium sp. OZ121 TaxID=3444183 RepID=UPI003F794DB7
MAAVATTLRSLLLTATGSVTVLGAVLAIRATTPEGQADVSPAPVSSPAGTLDGTLGRPGGTTGATGATGASGILGVLGTGLVTDLTTGGDRAPVHSQAPWGAPGRLGAPEPPGAPARLGDPAVPEAEPEAPLPRGTVVLPGTPVSPVVPIPLGAPAAPGPAVPPGIPIPPGASARSVFPGFPGSPASPQSPPLPPY